MSPFVAGLRAKVGTSLLHLPTVSAICRDGADRILLVRQIDSGWWGVPGGAIEPGESPEQAVAREMAEETGVTIAPPRLVTVLGGPRCRVEYPNGDQLSFVAVIYEVTVAHGTLTPDGEETSAVEWFAVEDLANLSLGPFSRLLLETGLLSP